MHNEICSWDEANRKLALPTIKLINIHHSHLFWGAVRKYFGGVEGGESGGKWYAGRKNRLCHKKVLGSSDSRVMISEELEREAGRVRGTFI